MTVSLCFNQGQESIICMHILVGLGAMKSRIIGMHYQLGGRVVLDPSNETLLPIVQYQQFGERLTFLIYVEMNIYHSLLKS
jgi:hypothetical protein